MSGGSPSTKHLIDTVPVLIVEEGSCSSSDEPVHTSKGTTLRTGTVRKLSAPDVVEDDELLDELAQSLESGQCDLSYMNLAAVPSMVSYGLLVTLILSHNRIRELPECVFTSGNCSLLRTLDASCNELYTVPDALFQLPNLEVLLLDHNRIAELGTVNMGLKEGTFLPSLRRVGLEFNELRTFPMEFFTYCPLLEELYLGQNNNILNTPISTKHLLDAAATRSSRTAVDVLLKVDNRPCFVKQMREEAWDTTMPWLRVELHKIFPDKVLPFLYLGSLRTAQTPSVYRDLNIEYVLTAARDMSVCLQPGMHHLTLQIDDLPGEDLRPVFDEAFEFIDCARDSGKGVLLHCFAGLSRSVTVAAAYLMSRYGKTRDEALLMIREVRPAAQPNSGFMDILMKYEFQLHAFKQPCGSLVHGDST
ncbi:Leucine rich repeat Dual specificity phosphatase catalytic domain [Trypanosoma vivax]|uniref:protein-tyrosine-phosphatase n=1 Tax=Trypanosoma vivax (strain Y486) TaxID=1055687 RepID=G0UBV5_TRYVY|nr:putative phopshatase [Trypanosoma vivax]KAH8609577.1 Leucine rich repeat Dual specificity phosphatase catalytic domain [Trypanosoma vivax]CCC53303.1 putative phopshatase [Trypanosoma vivax Y486]